MIFTKHRFEIWNGLQHPYKHTLGDFSYTNPAAPGASNIESAFNWIFAVLYPQTKASVADVASLPSVGNTLNDYRVVQDDGDGKAAAYRWEQREGEGSATWHKIYDMDWGSDSVLAAFQERTLDLYVFRRGYDDLDSAGAVVAGVYAGQVVTGGLAANSNLTLRANAGDGVGARTGFVQVDDQFRPTLNNTFDLGTNALKFRTLYLGTSALVSTLTLSGGSIIDSTGTISFDNENLLTTGNITGAVVTGSSLVASTGGSSITIVPGTITDTTGNISLGGSNLSTTGTLAAGITTLTDNAQTIIIDPDFSGVGRITSSTGTLDFDNENLVTTGTFTAGSISGTRLDIDNIRIDGNTVSVTNSNGNLIFVANGTGVIDLQSAMTTLGQTVTGILAVTGQLNADNLRLDGNTLSSTNSNGDINLDPAGTGAVISFALIKPDTDNSYDLGTTALRWNDIFMGGNVSNGTNSISVGTILTFRSSTFRDLGQTLPAQTGDSLFYDSGSGAWLASAPDSEIDHGTLSGLGDDDHTQYALLLGRAGGQSLIGGTASGNNLTFESTSHATKGSVVTKDNFIPFTNASFSGTWSGKDLGDNTHYFRDLYTKGEAIGFRMQNLTVATLPSASAQNIGRLVWATDTNKAYVDTGSTLIVLGASRFISDTSWNGTDVTKTVTVSSTVADARNCIWQLRDNANNFEIMGATLTTPNATSVVITVNVPLASGSYRLIGIE